MRVRRPTSTYPSSQEKVTEEPEVTVGAERSEEPWGRGGGASQVTAGGTTHPARHFEGQCQGGGRVVCLT